MEGGVYLKEVILLEYVEGCKDLGCILQKEKSRVEGQTQHRTLTQSQRQRQRVPEVPRGGCPLGWWRLLWQAGGEIPK